MAILTLVTGGARSGKSSYAEDYIGSRCASVVYLATAQVFDDEMQLRVDKHQKQRPASWQTFEAPLNPAEVITKYGNRFEGIILDCLTMYLTNLLLQDHSIHWDAPGVELLDQLEKQVNHEVEALLLAIQAYQGHFVAVTNEVGLGTVPGNVLSRFFRDCSGLSNRRFASAADAVFFIVSGIPMQLK